MHPKDKKAFEQIDAMMMNSDGPITDYGEIEQYLLRWQRKMDEIVSNASEETEEARESAEGTRAELMAKSGYEIDARLPGDTDGPRRTEDPMDYNRAQPTATDVSLVESFMEREFAREDLDRYRKSQFSRKLGLLFAMQFNRGFDAGVETVRDENGYSRGYNDALDLATTRLQGLERRKRVKKAKRV